MGRRAPDVRAVDLKTGATVSLRQHYKGQVVLVNLWATWCPPCREEMPAMERLYRELGPRGLKIAAVSVDEGDTQNVLAFTHELGLTFDILHDRDGSVADAYQVTGWPESFLLDKDGVIVKKVIGAHPWGSEANRVIVSQLLGVQLAPRPDPASAPRVTAAGPAPSG